MDGFKDLGRAELLAKLGSRIVNTDTMDMDELRALYAEKMVSASGMFEVIDGVLMPRASTTAPDTADHEAAPAGRPSS